MITRTSLLSLLLGLVALAGCGSSDGAAATDGSLLANGVSVVSPQEGEAMIDRAGTQLTVIDVRTPEEFAAGHLEGAVNLDLEGGQFSALIGDLPKDAAYLVYCHSGRRSAIAAATMAAAGFTGVHDLGGIVDWQAAGLPVVTG